MPRAPHSLKTFFATPEEAAAAFYSAFMRADTEAMMQVWAEDEDVVCVHPGAMPLVGYAAVRSAWESVFASSPAMRFELRDETWHTSAALVTQTVVEWIKFPDDDAARGAVAATNVFVRTMQGWRLLIHHGSPVAGQQGASSSVLH